MNIECVSNKGIDLIPVDSKLSAKRILFLDHLDNDSVVESTKSLLYLLEICEEKYKPVTIFNCATTNGEKGEMDNAKVIMDYISSYEDQIYIIAQGRLSFAASLVMSAGKVGNRHIMPGSSLCAYDPNIVKSLGRAGFGDDREVNERIKEFFKGISPEYKKAFDKHKERVDAEACVRSGLVDHVLSSVKEVAKTGFKEGR